MKRLAFLFVLLFFPIVLNFAQSPEDYVSALAIARAQIVPSGYLTEGRQVLGYIVIKNNTTEDVLADGAEIIIQTSGIAQHKMVTTISLFDGTTELGTTSVPDQSTQTSFLEGGLFTNVFFVIAPQSEKIITLYGDICGFGKIKVVLSKVYGMGKTTRHFYTAFGNETYFNWRQTSVQVVPLASITPEQRVVAPGSKRIKLPITLYSSVDVRSLDAVMVLHKTRSGSPKILFHQGFETEEWDYSLYNWGGDLRANWNAARLVLYGPEGFREHHTIYAWVGLDDALAEGDSVPISFGPARYNDSFTPHCEEGNIIVGPSIIFGDANDNNEKEITAGDANAIFDLLLGVLPMDENKLLRMTLAADLNGNGRVDDDDIHHALELIFDPYYLPPVLWEPQSFGAMGKVAHTHTSVQIEPRRNGNNIDYYLSTPVTSGTMTIAVPNIEKGDALQGTTLRIKNKENKTILVFASRKNIDVRKPIFTVRGGTIAKISGMVNGEIPISVSSVTGIPNIETVPTEFSLLQNYPNPFNPTTKISFSIPTASPVTITVFDVLGRNVATLMNSEQSAGKHELSFDASGFPTGLYVYTIHAGSYSASKKMLFLK